MAKKKNNKSYVELTDEELGWSDTSLFKALPNALMCRKCKEVIPVGGIVTFPDGTVKKRLWAPFKWYKKHMDRCKCGR